MFQSEHQVRSLVYSALLSRCAKWSARAYATFMWSSAWTSYSASSWAVWTGEPTWAALLGAT